jgi:phage-related protein
LEFIGTAREDLRSFPKQVTRDIGLALFEAQIGKKHAKAKPLKGFGGAGVLEVVENWSGDTYHAVYTVRLRHAIYVLHCFQKKSTLGIATSRRDLSTIERRLREAEDLDAAKGRVQ